MKVQEPSELSKIYRKGRNLFIVDSPVLVVFSAVLFVSVTLLPLLFH